MFEPADFVIRQDDTAPRLYADLTDAAGSPVVVTGADVELHLHGLTVDDEKSLVAAVDGAVDDHNRVYYDWVAGDTDSAGYYSGEWQVTYDNGQVETFPNDGVFLVQVVEQLA
jgi:hypothetical protein